MGAEILDWIEEQASDLYRTRAWRSQIARALFAWPRELSQILQGICHKITPEDLSSFLQDARMSTHKFRVVRRLREVVDSGSHEASHFAKSGFWILKACIPPDDRLLTDDIQSFAELLLLNKGHIDGIENQPVSTRTARSLHIRNSRDKHKKTIAPRRATLASLLSMLEDPSTTQVYLAFSTLRSLASAANTDSTGSKVWPTESLEELTLLKAYSSMIAYTPLQDMRGALFAENAPAPQGTKGFSEWITFLASTLCQVLSSVEYFYAPLISLVHEDPPFAEELLPVLIQAILQHECSPSSRKEALTSRQVLSEYFTRLLTSDTTTVPCRRVIVDTVLHLRYFSPPDTNDPLGFDKWLDIDFRLLSQSAVLCGAYTTALLFTELAAEYATGFTTNDAAVEQVLYEIYTHIDDPDGFYGIQTEDLYNYLLKRLHHENQWQKAFQFHGAALNTRTPDSIPVEGMLRSLHAFGLNHLAMNTLQNVTNLDDGFNLGSMTYDLGWRTETWDLPPCTSDTNANSIYLALRATHRERDRSAVETTVRRCLVEEMGRLRSLGDENTTEIREVARNILCLNEIRMWQRKQFQDKLREKRLDHLDIVNLSRIDQSVEYVQPELLW